MNSLNFKNPENQPNPIAFNPETMTVSQLKECADTLRTLFNNLHNSGEDLKHSLEATRDHMNLKWHGIRKSK